MKSFAFLLIEGVRDSFCSFIIENNEDKSIDKEDRLPLNR